MHSSKLPLLRVFKLNTACSATLQQQANLATHTIALALTLHTNIQCMRRLGSTTLGLKALDGRGIPAKHLKTTHLTMDRTPTEPRGKVTAERHTDRYP